MYVWIYFRFTLNFYHEFVSINLYINIGNNKNTKPLSLQNKLNLNTIYNLFSIKIYYLT